jgi:hypothetical protein
MTEELGNIPGVPQGDGILGHVATAPFTDGGQISRPTLELNELLSQSKNIVVVTAAAAALAVLGGTPPPFALGTSAIGIRSLIDSDLTLPFGQGDVVGVGIVSGNVMTEAGASSEVSKRGRLEQFDERFAHASAVAAPILVVLGAIGMAIGFARVPAEVLRRVFLPF